MSDVSSQSTVVSSTQSVNIRENTAPQQAPRHADQSESESSNSRVQGGFDVMGGIAEYCGSLTLSASARDHVDVTTTLRRDQRVVITIMDRSGALANGTNAAEVVVNAKGNGQHAPAQTSGDVDWPLKVFYSERVGELITAARVYETGSKHGCELSGTVLTVLRELLEQNVVPHFDGGLTIQIDSNLLGDVTRVRSAMALGVLQSVTKAFGVECGDSDAATLVQSAFAKIGEYPVGLATVAGLLIDLPGHLAPICCRPLDIGDKVALPEGVTLLGIDSGTIHPNAAKKYRHARTTSKMGTVLISRVIDAAKSNPEPWHGHLAGISVSEYVNQFRDILPTKIKGAQFLERFGSLDDPAATIDPKDTYKIRSRTEHHIYENERVRKFVERLAWATRTGKSKAIIEAGDLMYASHWSYGQRCGLGSCEIDILVKLLRDRGTAAGVYGARISGAGSGGTVVVLLRDADETRSAIAGAINQYEQKTGLSTTVQPAAVLKS